MNSVSAAPVRVSVIVPFLNAERFLAEAIESVLAQSYAAWELLLVDDGSSDGSRAVAESYAEQRPEKIFCLEHAGRQNRGVSASLNLGMTHARGDYLALLDADDLCEPQRLQKQVGFLDAHPEVALLGSWYSLIDESGAFVAHKRLPCEDRELRWELYFANQFANSAVMLRREPVLSHVGLHDESYVYAKDYELWCRIAERFAVANLPEYLIRYRVHMDSMTATLSGSETESNRLRSGLLAPQLGWDASDVRAGETLAGAIADLYYGWAESFEPPVLRRAIEEIFSLYTTFSEKEGVPPSTLRERDLRSRIAANLVMLTVFCSSAEFAVRSSLVARAWQLEPRVFLQLRTLSRAARALAGAYLPCLRLAPSGVHQGPRRRT
jgi:glycosyltransferase involved in cell wall biosynthesis